MRTPLPALGEERHSLSIGMGIGMVVWGLASVIIAEALVGSNQLGMTIVGTTAVAVGRETSQLAFQAGRP